MNFAAGDEFERADSRSEQIFLRPHGSLFPNGKDALHVSRVPKKVTAILDDQVIAERRSVLMLHEKGYTPVYYFPRESVAMDRLALMTGETSHCPRKGDAVYFTLLNGSRAGQKVAWSYEETIDSAREIEGYIAFYFDQVDRWLEDGDEISGSPADPFVRIDIRSLGGELVIEHAGSTVARTSGAKILYETGLMPRFYVPVEDILVALEPKRQQTTCIYKGRASYADVVVGDQVLKNAAWAYRSPVRECGEIAQMWCFDFDRFDAHWIDGVPVLSDSSFDQSEPLLKRGDKLA
jgi:uncharacterized protein (DUF427 family)